MDFLENKFLYLVLMIFSLLGPLLYSFDTRIKYYQNWNRLFKSILIMMIVFIPWDIVFTYKGIWHFNPNFILGSTIFLLPLEEWIFFLVIPFSCIFLHEVLCYCFPIKKGVSQIKKITILISFLLFILSLIYFKNAYTFVCFLFTSILLIYLSKKDIQWLTVSIRTYLVTLIPFLIINGFLTGSFTLDPVVIYNKNEIINFRVMNIPIEDFVYNLALILFILNFYYPQIKKSAIA